MELVILIAGFLGAWLLVAGPLLQAATELRDEDFDRDTFDQSLVDSIPKPAPISAWWWLLPPVAYVKNRRRNQVHRDALMAALSQEQRELFVGFSNKAAGWFTVAGGAFLIALKETWELSEHFELPLWLYFVAVVVLAILCIANTITRLSTSDAMIHVDEPGYRDRMRAEKRATMDQQRAQKKAGKVGDAGPQ